MRRRYIQDRETGELHEAGTVPPRQSGVIVQGDIEPYRSVITGELITSRSRHREHLKKHGHEEVGTEMPKFLRAKYERDGDRPTWGRDGRRIG